MLITHLKTKLSYKTHIICLILLYYYNIIPQCSVFAASHLGERNRTNKKFVGPKWCTDRSIDINLSVFYFIFLLFLAQKFVSQEPGKTHSVK